MLRCNKCGAENEDGARFCLSCAHKLQSRITDPQDADSETRQTKKDKRLLDLFDTGTRSGHGRYVEALAYAVTLAAGVIVSVLLGEYWPLYVLAGMVGLAAWVRRI